MSSIDQQFIEFVVKSLVGNPDAVVVNRRIDEKGVLLELTVDPEDLGRVIGKRGATAQSIRTLLRALGTKNDARYNLKIVDNGEEGPRESSRESSSESADSDEPKADKKPAKKDRKPTAEESQTDDIEDLRLDEDSKDDDKEESDRLKRTRQELADLDDLDV